MTRNRERRDSPPSSSRGARHFRRSAKPAPPASPQPQPERSRRERPAERRDSDLVRIYGFHSVEAALKAPRRALIRLYATAAAAERLKSEIAARSVETRILSLEE